MADANNNEINIKPLSIKQILIRIIVIISSVEFIIMLSLNLITHEIDAYSKSALDATLLALLSTAPIYLWVIKPFVSARDEAISQINHLAYIDPLTQLANRRLLSEHLRKAVASIIRHKVYGALMLLDLDRFKPVNDEYGHDAGDEVLIEIARRMKSITRSDDVVARLGGDEFLIYISHLDVDRQNAHDRAFRIANKLINLVSQPIRYHDKEIYVGASIGIRLLGFEELNPEAAIQEADIAMYRAKDAGRGRASFFDE
jgi:two-component system, cell cycle response regulator